MNTVSWPIIEQIFLYVNTFFFINLLFHTHFGMNISSRWIKINGLNQSFLFLYCLKRETASIRWTEFIKHLSTSLYRGLVDYHVEVSDTEIVSFQHVQISVVIEYLNIDYRCAYGLLAMSSILELYQTTVRIYADNCITIKNYKPSLIIVKPIFI